MENDTAARPKDLPWWTTPSGLQLGFLIPILLLVAYVGQSNLSGLTLRGVWFFTSKYLFLGVGLLLVTSLCCWIGMQIGMRSDLQPRSSDSWDLGAMVTGTIALVAYLIFFRPLLLNPLLLFHTFMGTYRPDRTNLEITAGITSFSNFTPVFFSIYAYKVLALRRSASRSMNALCAILIFLTAFRVYAWSERLALIEAVLPFALAGATRLTSIRNPLARIIGWGGPFLAIPMLILYFGLAEYVRSWSSAFYNTKSGFWEFALGRIASYYVTSLNNGAGLLQTFDWPTYDLEFTGAWLYKIPFFGPTFAAYLNAGGNARVNTFDTFLVRFADPEFNNPSGIYAVICDLGLPLGIAYFAVVGIVAGVMFRSYQSGRLSGVLLYPVFFLTFLEVFRYPYLGSQRAFTWMLGIGLAWLIGKRRLTHGTDVAQAVGPVPSL